MALRDPERPIAGVGLDHRREQFRVGVGLAPHLTDDGRSPDPQVLVDGPGPDVQFPPQRAHQLGGRLVHQVPPAPVVIRWRSRGSSAGSAAGCEATPAPRNAPRGTRVIPQCAGRARRSSRVNGCRRIGRKALVRACFCTPRNGISDFMYRCISGALAGSACARSAARISAIGHDVQGRCHQRCTRGAGKKPTYRTTDPCRPPARQFLRVPDRRTRPQSVTRPSRDGEVRVDHRASRRAQAYQPVLDADGRVGAPTGHPHLESQRHGAGRGASLHVEVGAAVDRNLRGALVVAAALVEIKTLHADHATRSPADGDRS